MRDVDAFNHLFPQAPCANGAAKICQGNAERVFGLSGIEQEEAVGAE